MGCTKIFPGFSVGKAYRCSVPVQAHRTIIKYTNAVGSCKYTGNPLRCSAREKPCKCWLSPQTYHRQRLLLVNDMLLIEFSLKWQSEPRHVVCARTLLFYSRRVHGPTMRTSLLDKYSHRKSRPHCGCSRQRFRYRSIQFVGRHIRHASAEPASNYSAAELALTTSPD